MSPINLPPPSNASLFFSKNVQREDNQDNAVIEIPPKNVIPEKSVSGRQYTHPIFRLLVNALVLARAAEATSTSVASTSVNLPTFPLCGASFPLPHLATDLVGGNAAQEKGMHADSFAPYTVVEVPATNAQLPTTLPSADSDSSPTQNTKESGENLKKDSSRTIQIGTAAIMVGAGLYLNGSRKKELKNPILLEGTAAQNRARLLQIPECAGRVVIKNEKSLLAEIKRRYSGSKSNERNAVYINELQNIQKKIGSAQVGYYPCAGADVLTLGLLAPDSSVNILTTAELCATGEAHLKAGLEIKFGPGLNNLSAVSGYVVSDGKNRNFDSIFPVGWLGIAAFRAVVVQAQGDKKRTKLPELYMGTFEVNKEGHVEFGPQKFFGSSDGAALWVKDEGRTKLFMWKKIGIDPNWYLEGSNNNIEGVHNLLGRVSDENETVMLAKAVNFELLDQSEANKKRYPLTKKLLSPPERLIKALRFPRYFVCQQVNFMQPAFPDFSYASTDQDTELGIDSPGLNVDGFDYKRLQYIQSWQPSFPHG